MKTLMTSLLTISLTMSSFTYHTADSKTSNSAVEKFTHPIVDALQQESVDSFVNLLPSIEEFHKTMNKHSLEYGSFLEEAKTDFGIQYTSTVVPAVHSTFNEVLQAGRERGIIWSEISLLRADVDELNKTKPVTLLLTAKGKEFKIIIDKPLWINGELKISQFIRLV
jgi:hypothetical protein